MIDILLVQDVEHLGKRGTRTKVKPGFARNFLLPLGYAVPATDDNIRRIDKVRVQWLAEEAKLLEEMRELATHLEKIDLLIVEKASEEGHLYGSVNEKVIADAVTAKGIAIETKTVKMEAPIKEVCDSEVIIRLHEEVLVTLPVRVRAEGREDWLPGQEEEAEEAAAAETEGEAEAEEKPSEDSES